MKDALSLGMLVVFFFFSLSICMNKRIITLSWDSFIFVSAFFPIVLLRTIFHEMAFLLFVNSPISNFVAVFFFSI